MLISIEFLIFLLLISEFGLWFLWFRISRWTHVRRYKKENDKGYLGEENRKRLIEEGKRKTKGRESVSDSTVPDLQRPTSFERSSSLQIPTTNDDGKTNPGDGETSGSNRKVGRKFRNPFFRRRGGKK